jgi:hypothetical protein
MRAFSSGTAGPVLGHLLRGLIDLAAGWLRGDCANCA